MAEFEALSHKQITKLSQENQTLSKDLEDTQQSLKQSAELEESSSKGQRATKKVDKADPEM